MPTDGFVVVHPPNVFDLNIRQIHPRVALAGVTFPQIHGFSPSLGTHQFQNTVESFRSCCVVGGGCVPGKSVVERFTLPLAPTFLIDGTYRTISVAIITDNVCVSFLFVLSIRHFSPRNSLTTCKGDLIASTGSINGLCLTATRWTESSKKQILV